ncbi:methyl-accepting chemotaxis protein [Poseidonocella sedimentorum]|uniref:Methyl-accepting chemotaxis protein n=1 Tax=Poseidonocella sedimentorum TaxID=871652 RepID=A0A1I6CR17_9RHOB|nr:methyl-accepting chemotaxis protein [Poseidonocella sedimentorum]SFQ95537.1 methyl-accepting chemotaxis protein [Poseidonocella sedimentorum]
MTALQDLNTRPTPDRNLTSIVETSASLGYEIVDLAGFLDDVDARSKAQQAALDGVYSGARTLAESNKRVSAAIDRVIETAGEMDAKVSGSLDGLAADSERIGEVSAFVQTLAGKMGEVSDALADVQSSTAQISGIATQVNILAINAKIEAARAGEAGRGFAVVAEEINELSNRTATSASGIRESIDRLAEWIAGFRKEADHAGGEAALVQTSSGQVQETLGTIASAAKDTETRAREIGDEAESVRGAVEGFLPAFEEMHHASRAITQSISAARDRTHKLIDQGETILQRGVAAGGGSSDDRFITRVKQDAAQIGARFEEALERGVISSGQLFSTDYRAIPGTDPEQVMTPFTSLTDKLLPPILEAALAADRRIVFCAAVDRNGYLPTHNKQFSQPQGNDPVENAAKSRNRRIFNDRVGLKAGRSEAPFLLQVYRRDMGGGNFKMMKDLSAPIMVRGRHWGGLRLAYEFGR